VYACPLFTQQGSLVRNQYRPPRKPATNATAGWRSCFGCRAAAHP
jgi:hypothetical protein